MPIPPTISHSEATQRLWDVVIVGAGPAGAMSAYLLARNGAGVLLVDKAAFPRWKVCGCCLTASALELFQDYGLGPLSNQGVPLTNIRLASGIHQASLPLPGWAALSRERLDAGIIEAAVSAGADFLPETTVSLGLTKAGQRQLNLNCRDMAFSVSAKVILAANGLGSRLLRENTRPGGVVHKASRIGAGAVLPAAPDFYRPGTIFMACGKGGYLGLVRVENDCLDAAAAFDPEFVREMGGLESAGTFLIKEMNWPAIKHLAEVQWRGTVSLTRHAQSLGGDRVLVLGDAAGYVEPFTGEGITWALKSAVAITPLVLQGINNWHDSLINQWTGLYHRIVRRRQVICRITTQVLRYPEFMRALLALMKQAPGLAQIVINSISNSS